ncbi:50S ribosomal protein L15e [Candidatus Bathyarchaeota archaeon]|nr:50S ribosomal protein L15e [Candidatus Bathyarchaeota archaeon]
MCAYKYMSEAWEKPSSSYVKGIMRESAIKWRRNPVILRLDKPTRLNRARSLGYRAKQGFVVVRVKIRKGGAHKPRPVSGRRPKAMGTAKYTRSKSLKDIAQDRVARKYPNLKVINTYWVWGDGRSAWYETILIDPNHPAVKSSL